MIIDALRKFVTSEIARINTAEFGKVEKYNEKKQCVDVTPVLKLPFLNKYIDAPVLTDVPVLFQQTQKTRVTFPINKGDFVLLVYGKRGNGNFLKSGKVKQEPETPELFTINSPAAIPGVMSYNENSRQKDKSAFEIEHEGQTITIKKNGNIEIGGGLLKKLITEDLISLYNNHVHPTTSPGRPTGLPAVPLIAKNVTTSKVQAE